MALVLRAFAVIGLAVAALAGTADRAEACSCDLPGLEVPVPGALDVPTNLAEVLVKGWSSFTVSVTETSTGNPVTLGAPIVESATAGGQHRFPVLQRLAPHMAYTVTVSELGQVARTTTFTSGGTDDTVPPPAITVNDLAIARARLVEGQNSSCGNELSQIAAIIEGLTGEMVALRVRITRDGVVQERTLGATSWALRSLGVEGCNVLIDLEPGASYEVAVSARDLAGNESVPFVTTVDVRACAPIDFRNMTDLLTCPLEGPFVDPSQSSGCRVADPAGSLALVWVLGALWRRRRRSEPQ